MKLIKLEAITSKANRKISQAGNIWKVMGQITRPDQYFFQSNKPHLYLVPFEIQTPKNTGGMWIREMRDPDFDYSEWNKKKT